MRIVHFIESLDPRDGGPPMVISRLAAEQARQGHQVTVLTTHLASGANRVPGLFAGLAGSERIAHRCLEAPLLSDRLGTRAQRELSDAVAGADMVHAHTLWDPLFLRAIGTCRSRSIPICLTPHGLLTNWSLKQKSLKKSLALAAVWKRALRQVSFFHLLTEDERGDLEPLGLNRPTVVIPNGVNPAEFADAGQESELDTILPKQAARRFVLFLGRIAYMKGVDILCDAFASFAARIPDIDLVLAGPDYCGYRATIEQQVQRLRLEQRIHLVGPVFGAAKVALLSRASCLCQPSRNEGFSVTILEALACGIPAVISTECHFPEVESSGAGIVTPVDVGQTAAALEMLLSSHEAVRRASDAARRLISSKYTLNAIASRLVLQYEAASETQRASRVNHSGTH